MKTEPPLMWLQNVPDGVLDTFVQAIPVLSPIPDAPVVVLPKCILSDGVWPYFLTKDIHATLDLVLCVLVEPWVGAFEEKCEGVNGANALDLLTEGD